VARPHRRLVQHETDTRGLRRRVRSTSRLGADLPGLSAWAGGL